MYRSVRQAVKPRTESPGESSSVKRRPTAQHFFSLPNNALSIFTLPDIVKTRTVEDKPETPTRAASHLCLSKTGGLDRTFRLSFAITLLPPRTCATTTINKAYFFPQPARIHHRRIQREIHEGVEKIIRGKHKNIHISLYLLRWPKFFLHTQPVRCLVSRR